MIAKPRGRSVDAFEKTLQGDVKAWSDLVDLAATGNPAAKKELFLKKVEFNHFADVAAARAAMEDIEGLSRDEMAKVEQMLVDQEFSQILGTVSSIEQAAEAGAKTVPMFEAGRVPASGNLPLYYWLFLGKHAQASKNADLLEASIDGLEELPRAPKPLVDELKEALKGIKG